MHMKESINEHGNDVKLPISVWKHRLCMTSTLAQFIVIQFSLNFHVKSSLMTNLNVNNKKVRTTQVRISQWGLVENFLNRQVNCVTAPLCARIACCVYARKHFGLAIKSKTCAIVAKCSKLEKLLKSLKRFLSVSPHFCHSQSKNIHKRLAFAYFDYVIVCIQIDTGLF